MGIHARFRQLINALDRRIFAADDAVALARGWDISRPPKGFGRVYRDPRWDLISECELCRGGLRTVAESCPSCGGTAADVVQQAWLAAVVDVDALEDAQACGSRLPHECLKALRLDRQGTSHIDETNLSGRTNRIVVTPSEPRLSEEALRVVQRILVQTERRWPSRHDQNLLGLLVVDPPLPYKEISRRLGVLIGSIGPTRARCLARLRRELATVQSRLKDTEDAEGGSPEGGRTGSYLLDDLLDKAELALREKFEPTVTDLAIDSSQSTGDTQLDDLLQRADAVLRSYLAEGTQRTEAELCAPEIASRPRHERSTIRLTPQELRVALVVADGATNVEAAAQLFLSVKTIEFHLSNIYRKLGIRSRVQLARSVFGSTSTPLGGGEARDDERLTAG